MLCRCLPWPIEKKFFVDLFFSSLMLTCTIKLYISSYADWSAIMWNIWNVHIFWLTDWKNLIVIEVTQVDKEKKTHFLVVIHLPTKTYWRKTGWQIQVKESVLVFQQEADLSHRITNYTFKKCALFQFLNTPDKKENFFRK